MNETKLKAIRQIVTQNGWQYIEEEFKNEILEGRKPINFKTEGKSIEMIALEVLVREKSAKIVDNVLKKLRRIAQNQEYKKEDWK